MNPEILGVEHARWFNPYKNLTDFMLMCKFLPRSYQQVAGDRLMTLVQVYYDVLRENHGLKPVDEDIQMRLEKGKARQRWYDQIEDLHQALNLLLEFQDISLKHVDWQCQKLIRELYAETEPLIAKPAEIVFIPWENRYGFKLVDDRYYRSHSQTGTGWF